jgi:hypothetical protein
MVIVLAIACVAPHLRQLWANQYSYTYSIVQITDPFSTIIEVGENSYSVAPIAMLLGFGVFVALLLNLRAVKQGISEVVDADVRPRTAESPVATTVVAEGTA